MERNISETPDNWVILKIQNKFCKVFGTWAGDYLNGDSWKLNSGIQKVEQDDSFYYFIGASGSCYKCHKKGYGTATSYGLNILYEILKKGKGEIELMDDVADWSSSV